MCQSVSSFGKLAVWNVVCASVYFCGRHKNNLNSDNLITSYIYKFVFH